MEKIHEYMIQTRVIYLGENTHPPVKKIKITNYIIHKQNAPHDSGKKPTKNTKIN